MKSKFPRISLATILIAAISISDMTMAEIEEIVVTARFRDESVQDISGSISAIGSDVIGREGIADFEDIARRTAGLNLFDRGPNQNEVSIRGISNNTALFFADNGQTGPLVSQYVDDISVAASLGSQRDFNFFDFERVEVLRGPQPTLFGEGSVGGTIRYFTRNPDLSGEQVNDSVLKTGVSFTEDGGTNFTVSAASSLILVPDVFGIRGVINYRDDDGYIDNPVLGDKDFNDYESVSGRVVAVFQPNENLTARFSAFLSRDEAGGTNLVDAPSALNSPGDLTLHAPVGGGHDDDFDLFSGKVEYDFGPITATSITGYFQRDRSVRQFNAPSLAVFCPFILGAGSPSCSPTGFSNSEDESFSQEFRLVSNFEGRINFIAGAYYQDTELAVNIGADAPEFANPVYTAPVTSSIFLSDTLYESEQYSGFVEVTLSVTDSLRLIGGVRYVNEEITSTAIISTNLNPFALLGLGLPPLPMPTFDALALTSFFGFPVAETFELDEWLPRGAIELDVAEDVMVYGLVAKGMRNGNLNSPSSAAIAAGFDPVGFANFRTHDEDSATSFEIGAKANWMNNTLTTNIAISYTSYDDPLLQTSVPFVLGVNGPDIDITGVEFEGLWQLNDFFSAYANIGYLDAEFDGEALLLPAVAALGLTSDLNEGNAPANAPEWRVSLGGDMRYPIAHKNLTVTGHIGYQYVDSSFSTPQNFPSTELDSQNFLNLRLGLEAGNWSLTGFAANVTNEIEYQHIEYTAAPFINANGELDNVVIGGSANRPRTLGIEFAFRY